GKASSWQRLIIEGFATRRNPGRAPAATPDELLEARCLEALHQLVPADQALVDEEEADLPGDVLVPLDDPLERLPAALEGPDLRRGAVRLGGGGARRLGGSCRCGRARPGRRSGGDERRDRLDPGRGRRSGRGRRRPRRGCSPRCLWTGRATPGGAVGDRGRLP